MEEVILAFGSNLGDRSKHLQNAYDLVNKRCGEIKRISGPMENEPVGFESNDLFLNSCVLLITELSPMELLFQLKEIEREIGRENSNVSVYTSRIIDIDIIFYGNQIFKNEHLQIPHPKFHERTFVLEPLSAICPNWIDPLSKLSIMELHNQIKLRT